MPARVRSFSSLTAGSLFLFLSLAQGAHAAAGEGDAPPAPPVQCDPLTAAAGPLYLWPLGQECEVDAQAVRDAITELSLTHHRAPSSLFLPPAATPNCVGAACVDALRTFPGCEHALERGTLLGGWVEARPAGATGMRIHLWRYDLDSLKSWQHELDLQVCQNGVCGNGRFADQDLQRLRPSQRLAIALGLLAQARLENDFRSCVPGCQRTREPDLGRGMGAAPACQPPGAQQCAPGTSRSAGAALRLAGLRDSPSTLTMAKGWLGAGVAGSFTTFIVLAGLNASPVAHLNGPTVCNSSQPPSCSMSSINMSFNSALWIAGGATLLFGVGLATTLGYEYRNKKGRIVASNQASPQHPSRAAEAEAVPPSACPLIGP